MSKSTEETIEEILRPYDLSGVLTKRVEAAADRRVEEARIRHEMEVLSGVFINSPTKPAVGHLYIEVGDEDPILLSDYLRALAEIELATLKTQTTEEDKR